MQAPVPQGPTAEPRPAAMISLRQLRYFASLAETGHFGRAADRCAVSQPALSMQIRELEKSLGVALVERLPGGLRLTEEGREVARRAHAIEAATRDLVDYARHRRQPLSGRLRLGVIPSIAPYLLPRLLPLLRRRHPELALALRETQTRPLIDELLTGELDILLLALPVDHPELETRALFDDPFLLACRARPDLDRSRPVTPEAIAPDSLLLLEEGHCLRDQTLNYCRTVRPEALSSFGATSLATIMQMVANGYGVTLLPAMAAAVEVKDERLALLPFADPPPARTVGLAWRRTSPRRPDFEALGNLLAELRG